jgi:contractile injection system tube protein
MPSLKKATLTALDPDTGEEQGTFAVQFNPASLRFTLQSVNDRGQTPARQTEQHLGSGNVTLALDLHFDTADEGTTDAPVNVRTRTAEVAKFMLPADQSAKPPPRVRFHWGDFVLTGVMESYQEEVDLFSPQGVPLRSKVSISISAQDPKFAAGATGPAAKTGAGATVPGGIGGAPGTVGFGASLSVGASASLSLGGGLEAGAGVSLGGGAGLGDRTGVALGGESAAEFAARMGVDPNAWRGVAGGLDSTISLDAGTEIDFSSNLSANTGLGAAVGVEAGRSASVEESVGLGGEAASSPRAGAAPGTASGMALAAAGGVQAAVAAAQTAEVTTAASDAKQAYGLAAPAPETIAAEALVPPAALQPRPPLRSAELPVPAEETPAAPPPRQPDARATTFGHGVPLRTAVIVAADNRSGALGGVVALGPRARRAVETPVTPDPTKPPWLALPDSDARRRAADAAQQRRPTCPCGCDRSSTGCGCGCGGGYG